MHRYLFWGIVSLSVVFLLALGTGYALGYRIGPGITLVKVRSLTITHLVPGATVFIDRSSRGTAATSTMTLALVPGHHAVLISAPNTWPFSTIVTIPENKNATLAAFLIPHTPNGTLLEGPAAKTARAAVAHTALPTITHPLVMENGCALVSVNTANQIIAAPTTTPACTPPPFLCLDNSCAPTIVFSPKEKPTAVLPYPGRQDALLVGIGKVIYALSLDPRSPQTFAPLLQGISPRIATDTQGTVVVDQSAAYKLTL